MAEYSGHKNDVIIFVYQDECIKSITDPVFIPQINDETIINKIKYDVVNHIVDMDENKIFIYLR